MYALYCVVLYFEIKYCWNGQCVIADTVKFMSYQSVRCVDLQNNMPDARLTGAIF